MSEGVAPSPRFLRYPCAFVRISTTGSSSKNEVIPNPAIAHNIAHFHFAPDTYPDSSAAGPGVPKVKTWLNSRRFPFGIAATAAINISSGATTHGRQIPWQKI